MKKLKFLLLFGIAFLLLSCEKDFSDSEELNNQDMMLKSGRPDQPGDNLKVFRYEATNLLIFIDEGTNLVAVVGNFVDWSTFNVQEIYVDEGDEINAPRIIQQVKQKDLPILVWEFNPESPINWENLLSTEPVFEGTGHMVYTDNDVAAPDRDGNNYNAFGCRINGVGINIKYHAVWDGVDLSTIKESISIKLN